MQRRLDPAGRHRDLEVRGLAGTHWHVLSTGDLRRTGTHSKDGARNSDPE
jgi:hypothetical protein